MRRGLDRRELLVAGLGLWAVPWSAARADRTTTEPGGDDLSAAEVWAARALAALERCDPAFDSIEGGAVCDLGGEGRLEVTTAGPGAVRVTLLGLPGELEILRALDAPQVARVEARMEGLTNASTGPCYDTLRRTPGGFELTFSSALALRHAVPKRVRGELSSVYERLASAAVDCARPLLG